MSKYKNSIPYTCSVIDLIPKTHRKSLFKIKKLEWLLKYESKKDIKGVQ